MNTHIYGHGKFRVRKSYSGNDQTVLEIADGHSTVVLWFPHEDAVRDLADKLVKYVANLDESEEV